ncbi:MAG: energy-coupling factor transporter transmembrane protein EcfT [Candidatus Odinarchaeota archaeon]|nr:energy-coupling factor transporter transmembrane protein EcfT [Candidatus Odinarchaeota archaeon]
MSSRGYVLYFKGNTLIHKFDPRTKIILLVFYVLLALIYSDPIYLGAVLLSAIIIWVYSRIPIKEVNKIYRYVYATLALLILIQGLSYSDPNATTILRVIPENPLLGNVGALTVEGLIYGIAISERILILMLIGPLVIYTTPLDRLILGLIKFKMPYTLAFIMSTSLNLLPSVQIEIENIQEAQTARAFTKIETGSFMERMKAYIPLMVPLVVGMVRNSTLLSLAMASRAFGVSTKRTFYHEISLKMRDKIAIAIIAGVFIILAYARFVYGMGGFNFTAVHFDLSFLPF